MSASAASANCRVVPPRARRAFARACGFTLIELLVVVAILLAISYLGFAVVFDTQKHAEDRVARAQLLVVAQALRQFKADTGYYPGQGPFALNQTCALAGVAIAPGALRPTADVVPAAMAGDACAWFQSPANLLLLFRDTPLPVDAAHAQASLLGWDAAAQRGWRGPYLPRAALAWLDIGTNIDGGTLLVDVPAQPAGPSFPPVSGAYLRWRAIPSWQTGYDSTRDAFGRHPRPILHFDLERPESGRPRLVHAGPDGVYGGENLNDACLPNLTAAAGRDDLVVCLE